MGKHFFEGKIDGKLYFNEKDKMVLDMTQYLFQRDTKKLSQS